ncbi:MAG: transaldolase family protein [Pseudomonadota bacterium]
MLYLSKLHETVSRFPTDFWNDSCAQEELTYAIENGAVGATTNPTIVLQVLTQELPLWRGRIQARIAGEACASEHAIAWWLVEEMAKAGAALLLPIFERERGLKGRLSAQTDPTLFRDAAGLAAHAVHLSGLAPNMQVKIPVTAAGVRAIEEATFQGVSVNATVCFTVPQALAVGAAVERGLARRAEAGLDSSTMSPVCTIMVGRMDDWLKVLRTRDGLVCEPGLLDWAGIAVIKKAYALFQARGYRTRLLAAAYRHHMHWSELIGGDVILTIPYGWQRRFNASDISVEERFSRPVDPAIVARLRTVFPDFERAWAEDGLRPAEFDGYGATARTLRGFIQSTHDLQAVVRDFMLPDPDKRG